jgi:hypothetical protein
MGQIVLHLAAIMRISKQRRRRRSKWGEDIVSRSGQSCKGRWRIFAYHYVYYSANTAILFLFFLHRVSPHSSNRDIDLWTVMICESLRTTYIPDRGDIVVYISSVVVGSGIK